MAAYRRVYDSCHLQADCQEPGSTPEPYAQQLSMGYLYLYLLVFILHLLHVYAVIEKNTEPTNHRFAP